ncbi:MAG TPA: sensor histidine kinase [Bryobacteraceae bacterium]|nr:sensor histidine kinase [Bryobacteraceae bacterium]
MPTDHEPLIVNAVGHLAGAIVFGIFLALALRRGAGRRLVENWLSVVAAGLAWLWNAGSFAMLTLPPGSALWAVGAVSFSSLSLLPAVLLHKSLNGRFRPIAALAYLLSAIATAMHLYEAHFSGIPLHKWALGIITIGFGILTVITAAAILFSGRESTRSRTSQVLASMCLLLFAVTFSHFGAGHPPKPWSIELVVHHAGIPIALWILLQDYRFLFVDAFARFLANVMLAALLGFAGLRLAARLTPGSGWAHPLRETLPVVGVCALLILFAHLRGLVQKWLTMVVFRQGDIGETVRQLRSQTMQLRSEAAYLPWAAERLAAFAGADRFDLIELPEKVPMTAEPASITRDPRWNWAETVIPIRFSQGDARQLLLGRRRGGRRYLSEDIRALHLLAATVGEEVDRFRIAEMQRLVSEAELRALRAQINPHFLFNALNTIYGIIPREAAGARRTVLNLADIFRYCLQTDKILIPLSEELKIIRSYLDIERLRLGPRLRISIEVDPEAERTLIPILSIQPLVENAIKHGVSISPDEGWLRISAKLDGRQLVVLVEDSGPGSGGEALPSRGAGVGLANVTRRLQLCFGPEAGVEIQHGAFGTKVHLLVPLPEATVAAHP